MRFPVGEKKNRENRVQESSHEEAPRKANSRAAHSLGTRDALQLLFTNLPLAQYEQKTQFDNVVKQRGIMGVVVDVFEQTLIFHFHVNTPIARD